ncbi:MAG: glycosyltransferase family 39 protein [Deltaproteobacteria bacterium]
MRESRDVPAGLSSPTAPSSAAWGISAGLAAVSSAWLGAGLGDPAHAYWDEGFYITDAHRFFDGGPLENPEHPPLGKFLIGLGIQLAGDTALGWRAASFVASVLLVASLPLWLEPTGLVGARAPRWLLALPSCLLLVDPLFYVTARLATLDALLTLFYVNAGLALLAARAAKDARHGRALRVLAGALAGLALGTKWTALTLAPVFVVAFVRLDGKHLRADRRALLELFGTFGTVYLGCFALPGATHFGLHAFPQVQGPLDDALSWPERVVSLHYRMVSYHTYYVSSDQRSAWFEWFLARQPLWYALRADGERFRVIAAIGSPFVWFAGEVATLVLLVRAARARDAASALLAALPLAQLLFWALVLRMTFLYYMTAIVPFFALALAHLLARERERAPGPSAQAEDDLGRRVKSRTTGIRAIAVVALLTSGVAWHAYVLPLLRGEPLDERALRAFAASPAAPLIFHRAFPIDRVLQLARDGTFGTGAAVR